MNNISYKELTFNNNNKVNTFNFLGKKIEVLEYLPIEDKYDLIAITLQQAEEEGIFNELKLDVHFHLNLVYMYSNLSFTDEDKENEMQIYDNLATEGFFDPFLTTIPEEEYNVLLDMLEKQKVAILKYRNTFGGIFHSFVSDLPKQAEVAKKIVNEFDPEKYQNVIDFAMAANGNRPIPKNIIPIK